MQTAAVTSQQPTATTSLGQSSEPKEDAPATAVDFQNFLTLLTAQLRNQDPLSPADSTDFVAQLASFSSVEQLVRANDRLDSIASAVTGGGIDQYADWIGREAEAPGASVFFSGEPVRYRVAAEAGATRVETVIFNEAGDEVARIDSENSGRIQTWNGEVNGNPVANGVYKISATYYNDEGLIRTEEANTFGVVNEVRLAGGNAVLGRDGGIDVDPTAVVSLSAVD